MTVCSATIDAELDKILAVLVTALQVIGNDKLIDLSALDTRIRQVCDAMRALPPAQVRPLTLKLENILAELDRLGEAMTHRYGDLPVLPNHTGHGTGAAAYADMLKHFP